MTIKLTLDGQIICYTMISIQTLFAKETKTMMMKIVSLQIINYNSNYNNNITRRRRRRRRRIRRRRFYSHKDW